MKPLPKFAAVGTLCFVVQFLLLQVLERIMAPPLANWIGFILSAQLNFVLSYTWTWNHFKRKTGVRLWYRWGTFMVFVVFGSSLANVFAFTIASTLWHLPDILAVLLAIIVSSGVSFVAQRYIAFRPAPSTLGEFVKHDTVPATFILDEPEPEEARLVKPGIAFFMPAHNEAENLPYSIGEAVSYLSKSGERWCLIIVDDGSTDGTADIVNGWMLKYPGHVQLVTHSPNKGYGAALRSGFQAGLAMDYEWIGFCDSDRQFKPGDMGALIAHAVQHDADIVIGYRERRADGLKRLLMGRAWHLLSRLVLGYVARDVDCGFKLFRHRALIDLVPLLKGDHAVISPEILARAYYSGHKIVELPVAHYQREAGEQTGANFGVIVKSLHGLFAIRRAIQSDTRPKPANAVLTR